MNVGDNIRAVHKTKGVVVEGTVTHVTISPIYDRLVQISVNDYVSMYMTDWDIQIIVPEPEPGTLILDSGDNVLVRIDDYWYEVGADGIEWADVEFKQVVTP